MPEIPTSESPKENSNLFVDFLVLHSSKLSELKKDKPNEYAHALGTLLPDLVTHFQPTTEALLSLKIAETALRSFQGNPTLELALLDGLKDSAVSRPSHKDQSKLYQEFFFAYSNHNPLDPEVEALTNLRTDDYLSYAETFSYWLPRVFGGYDNSEQATLAISLAKRLIETAHKRPEVRRSLVKGLLTNILVTTDFAESEENK